MVCVLYMYLSSAYKMWSWWNTLECFSRSPHGYG